MLAVPSPLLVSLRSDVAARRALTKAISIRETVILIKTNLTVRSAWRASPDTLKQGAIAFLLVFVIGADGLASGPIGWAELAGE